MIDSPCNDVCTEDPETGLCIGCNRTKNEIVNWLFYSDEQASIDFVGQADHCRGWGTCSSKFGLSIRIWGVLVDTLCELQGDLGAWRVWWVP